MLLPLLTCAQIRHVLVVGHYGCGGVRAAASGKQYGLIDNWLRHVQARRRRVVCLSHMTGCAREAH